MVSETVQEAELSLTEGLVGDNWKLRGNRHMPDGSANPQTQITIMNARSAALVAQSEDRWPLAGDQLYVDLDLSDDNLPPVCGLRLVQQCSKFHRCLIRDARNSRLVLAWMR